MKKTIIVLMMVLLSLVLLVVSCDDKIDSGNDDTSKKNYTVTFNSNGGSDVVSVLVKEGEKVTKPTDPTKDGFEFTKWTTDENGTEEYNFDSAVTKDITLYAQWIKVYKVGDKGPAGGIIFYVNPNYEEGSADSDKNWKYLEAAPAYLSTQYTWGPDGKEYNTTDEGVGKGKSNTDALIAKTTDTIKFPAAQACVDYEYTNPETNVKYDDWFLPSIGELGKLCNVKDKLGSGASECYWSSTAHADNLAKAWSFGNATWLGEERDDSFYVRPVRAFN